MEGLVVVVKRSDVIIVGAGIAGLVAAYECLNQGKSVLIIERNTEEHFGGLAKLSFGGMALVGTPLQKRLGIKDTPAIALEDWNSFANFGADDVLPKKWAEQYVHESVGQVYHWLANLDLNFFPVVNWVERGLYHRGNSVPRYHVLWGTGYRLVERFEELLKKYLQNGKLKYLFEHKVTDLIKENGRIVGCIAEQEKTESKDLLFYADHVIVATGGITGCLDKVREHWYKPWGQAPKEMLNGSHPYADGLVHEAVSRHGGNLTHLDKMWNYAAGIPNPKPQFEAHGLSLIPCKSALWLDHSGRRIGPEPMMTGFDTNELCRRISQLEKPHTWQLLNWRIAAKELAVSGSEHNPMIRDRKLVSFLKEILLGNHRLIRQLQKESDHFIVAKNLHELVDKMNQLNGDQSINYEVLKQEITQYDDVIKRGKGQWNDDQLRRILHARSWRSDKFRTCAPKPILDPSAGPLIAIKLRLITRKSLGGIQTDLQSRVLDKLGAPIDGLYAVGEAAGFGGGGASGFKSLEGTFLSGCILTARAAAKSIHENLS
ncbi:FAD-binding dehydrogenase [Leptospira brenneri]|uniref:FAD-binding dehydrogenase n=2 Tax=Leptospira brenneri TaxID=2023182 RepID=A0A2M9Y4V6_9LEPT|nr:FAD-binding dehydrogenase [Leptospira brenneri]TGK97221.1 FAD-binding dehydrogenase [Leptospira brenneri]